MRYLVGFVCVLALGVMPVVGCTDDGGMGGSGGSAGDGGAGGNGAACDGNVCACTEEGISAAIAEGGGPFTFDCDGPITVVTSAEIAIDNDVILDGERNLTVDANDTHRVFSVATNITTELRRMTITRGAPRDDNPGGGIYNEGELTLTNCTVSGNSVSYIGGGGIFNESVLTLTNSTVSGNLAEEGGGIFNFGMVTMTSSTVSNNSASRFGGGISSNGTLTLTNSTVSGNTALSGGGIRDAGGTLTLTNSTVSGNTAGDNILNIGGEALTTFTNSLVVGGCTFPDATITTGHNIESPGDTCGFDGAKGDQVNITEGQLNLGPLADNGGPTMTHALLPDSVAIDVIPGEECVDVEDLALATDQRGVARPQGLECDVGAFEYADCAGSPCDDGKECTADHCNPSDSSWCAHTILPDATFCDLGGEDGVCFSGACVPNSCPMLFYINASPSTIPSGQSTTMIETRARDADGLPLPLLLSLSAPWGSFENTENIQEPDNVVSQQASYVCDRPGLVEICAEATDGACMKKLCTNVMCPT